MNKIITSSLVAISIVSGVLVAPLVADATTINGNRGSIIKTSGGGYVTVSENAGTIIKASGTASDISNNRGSIIKIDGRGQDINKVLAGVDISNNRGSIIKIENVCGTVTDSSKIHNNRGTIIKIESNNDTCEVTVTPAKPVTPVTPKTPETPANPVTPSTPEEIVMPTELPRTGMGSTAVIASFISLMSAGATYLIRRG